MPNQRNLCQAEGSFGSHVGGAVMIASSECNQHAVECRQMAARAPNPTVHAILIDMARTWDRLALQVVQSSDHPARVPPPITLLPHRKPPQQGA